MKRDFDLVFDLLYKRNDIDKNTLFIFWDILRCINGDYSCIDMHNIYANELRDKLRDAISENQENHNQEKQKEDCAHQESGIFGKTPIPGIESDTLQSRTDESDSLILKKSCKNCHYYDPDWNGDECCTLRIFNYSGRVEELPKERTCENFANQKSSEVKK